MARELSPRRFLPHVYFPKEIHPLGGLCRGEVAALQRWALVAQEHDLLRYDTSDLMIQKNRAGLELIGHYRHKVTGLQIETTIANFWSFEDGWPVKFAEYHDIERVRP